MRINELFTNNKVEWKWDYKSRREVEATFVISNIQYKFYAYSFDQNDIWEVEFKIVNEEYVGSRFGLTGTGNASLVMSTVVDILREFIKEYSDKITQLIFSAKEDSRRDLYARMVRRLLPTWKFEKNGANFKLTSPKST